MAAVVVWQLTAACIAAAFASPEAVELEMSVEQEHPAYGSLRQVGIPFRLSAMPG